MAEPPAESAGSDDTEPILDGDATQAIDLRQARLFWLTARYVLALSLVALLIVVGQVLVQRSIDRQEYDARTINIAGRQRMLSQRIGKYALTLHHETDPATTARARAKLAETVALWRRSQHALIHGDREMGLNGRNSAEVRRLLHAIEPSFDAVGNAVDRLLTAPDPGQQNAAIAIVLRDGDSFLEQMDHIVFTYDREARARVSRLQTLELILTGAALLVLLCEALLIFRPAVRRLRKTLNALLTARRESERLARHDGLTGLANRRHFDDYLDQECRRATRDLRPLSLVLLDVDHFKQYNETFGHQTGDRCLIVVASALRERLRRPGDLVARYGGDEFVAVLPNTDLDGARQVAEGLRDGVKALGIEHTPVTGPLTISVGVACADPTRESFTPDQLLFAADDALLRAKREQRDRVVTAQRLGKRPTMPPRFGADSPSHGWRS